MAGRRHGGRIGKARDVRHSEQTTRNIPPNIGSRRDELHKSYALLLGNYCERAVHLDSSGGPYNEQDPRRIDNLINWTTLERFSDKYHGIRLTDEPGAEQQWTELKDSVVRQAGALKVGQNRSSIEHRVAYLKMYVISRIIYPMTYQSPRLNMTDGIIAKM